MNMAQRKELTVEAVTANVDVVTDFVNEQLEQIGCPLKAQMQIDVAIDEIFSNISYYAYAPDTGPATVQLEYCDTPPSVRLAFIDSGVPYDPLQKKDPDVTVSAEARQVGGLGIYIVKKSMDAVSYERRDGKNVLTLQKNL